MKVQYHLYSSIGCHLCEQAIDIISSVIDMKSIKVVDIVEDKVSGKDLVALYGLHIPVLTRLADNSELFWPFDTPQIIEFTKSWN